MLGVGAVKLNMCLSNTTNLCCLVFTSCKNRNLLLDGVQKLITLALNLKECKIKSI